jgi:surface polysaccharide O-acyltransferase-like enzyme
MTDIPSEAPAPRPRQLGLDALRYVGAFLVVFLHALPTPAAPVPLWLALAGAACVPAVPVFFMLSGYFLHSYSRVDARTVLRPLRRLVPVYLAWVLIYFLLLHLIPLRPWSFPPSQWLWGGSAYHLWFLPALALALIFVATGLSVVGPELTGMACLALGLFALGRGAYHDLLHLPGVAAGRNEQYAGPLYVYVGFMLARLPIRVGWGWLVGLVIAAYMLVFGEQVMISRLSGEPLTTGHDVVISVFILSAAIVLLAKALPETSLVCSLARLGQVSMGVYLVHLFFVWLVMRQLGDADLPQVITLTVVVLAISTVVSLALQRIPTLRFLVR